jgi:3-phenylpropionate/cinnamic acid dioxygenase small subunit
VETHGDPDDEVNDRGAAEVVMDDVQVIKNHIYRYAELLDLGDLEGLRSWFDKVTVRVDGGSAELRGVTAFQELVERPVCRYNDVPSTKHLVTNVIIEIDHSGGTAAARSYYVAFQARPELPLQPIIAGRWHDRFERRGETWEIVDRTIYVDLLGDLSHHIAPQAS